ncbi:ribbon-helix-helix domain-containing protein [Brevundimonas sp. SL130]|uniref:ribbon-helix-helix domain-containing protein n=1 Tax=Brevundimonas sp. SL130 TaxID=2995143 RepID=UPI00226D1588|nr:type II toxin-antitoxin system ParD family antitoxin [Brevundimonas sp. SL130]WAC59518.1 type II toxin-antitoxin system ParD family antitoxin [Brevundimonas sp. SL130]
MATLTLSLPDSLKAFIDAQVADQGLAADSDYVLALLQLEQEKKRVRDMLIEGRDSGPGQIVDDAYFERLRDRIRRAAE